MPDLVVGVDGGNSKTDLVLADTEGRLLSWVRGEGTRPHAEGMETTTERLARLGRHALVEAGFTDTTPVPVGAYFLATWTPGPGAACAAAVDPAGCRPPDPRAQ